MMYKSKTDSSNCQINFDFPLKENLKFKSPKLLLQIQTALDVPWAGKCAGENNGSRIDSIVLAKVARGRSSPFFPAHYKECKLASNMMTSIIGYWREKYMKRALSDFEVSEFLMSFFWIQVTVFLFIPRDTALSI